MGPRIVSDDACGTPGVPGSGTDFLANLSRVNSFIAARSVDLPTLPTTSNPVLIDAALRTLPLELPSIGCGLTDTTSMLLETLCPALSSGHAGPRFFGLVTGGVNPTALLADQLVTTMDQNVQLHLPDETISTTIEHITLKMVVSLLGLPVQSFTANAFTTGATASNILALSIGREHTISRVQRARGILDWTVSDNGFGGVEVEVFCAGAHSSVAKSASLVGIGRRNVFDIATTQDDQPCAFDLGLLEERLKANVGKKGSIVVSSFGEVNTGGFTPDTEIIRALCDKYDAWLHIDAAFGAFAVLHPDFEHLSAEMALADSITSDAHKWMNVPYDCGIFLSTSPSLLRSVLGPGSVVPTYLSTNTTDTTGGSLIDEYRFIPSPLFSNIENSRRFRALPVYASLISLGRDGLAEMIVRNISFARTVETWMRSSPFYDILTPPPTPAPTPSSYKVLNIVLFAPSSLAPTRFQGPGGAALLCQSINASKECYVTGTTWRGRGGIRLAVSNWDTRVERDWEIVRRVLERAMEEE